MAEFINNDENDWDKEPELNENERAFINKLNEETAKDNEVKEKFENVKNTILEIFNKTTHSIRDSIMIAVNPTLTYEIGSQQQKYEKLAKIENIIYRLITQHFTSITGDITLESIRDFITNNGSIKALITLAFKRNLSAQNRNINEIQELQINDNAIVAYIINLLCNEVDYTNTEYDNENLQDMLGKCLPSEEELKIEESTSNFAVGSGISYRQDPVTTSWYKIENGKETLIPLNLVKNIPELQGINPAGQAFKRQRVDGGKRKTKKHHKKSKRNHKSNKSKTNKKAKKSKRKH